MKTTSMKTQSASPRVIRRRVRFHYRGDPGSQVCLAGDFNQWQANAHVLEDKLDNGEYRTALLLEPGAYEYKFVVDGVWQIDPLCNQWTRNDLGTLNSQLKVHPSDGSKRSSKKGTDFESGLAPAQ